MLHCKKVFTDVIFLLLNIYDSALFKTMFQNCVLG